MFMINCIKLMIGKEIEQMRELHCYRTCICQGSSESLDEVIQKLESYGLSLAIKED